MKKNNNILIFDLGSTHLKACVLSPKLEIIFEEHQDNIRRQTQYYETLDVQNIGKFIFHNLTKTVDTYDISDIVVSTHGSSIALVKENPLSFDPFDDTLALPVMFYGQEVPKDIRHQYNDHAPHFLEVFSEISPLALTGGLQLFWQAQAWPKEFKTATKIMMWPSYWSYRLSGAIFNDYSSLGAQNQLWNPVDKDFSSLVKNQGWDCLFAPVVSSSKKIGVLHPKICAKYHLKKQPNILCGVHDSNANYWRFVQMGFDQATIMSTGTWIVNFNPLIAPKDLVGKADCCVNTSVLGNALSCSRYQGGKEFSIILKQMGDIPVDSLGSAQDVNGALQSKCLILPSFASSGGPVRHSHGQGKILGNLPDDDRQKYALATIYLAFMSKLSLDYIKVGKMLIIDGPFTKNPLFLQLMALLNPSADIYISKEINGTLWGAALLSDRIEKSFSHQNLQKVSILLEYADLQKDIHEYQKQWHKSITNNIYKS